MNLKKLFSQLKRRNAIKSGLAYLLTCWVIIQVMSIILPAVEAPAYFLKWLLVVLAIGFPIWIILAYVYEITPEGIKKTTSVDEDETVIAQSSIQLNKIIIGALFIAIALLFVNIFRSSSNTAGDVDSNKSIAVLAFTNMSSDKEQDYFSDGISEEILNLLAKIPDLKVISRTSSFSFKGKDVTTDEIGKTLHVNHILEGSVRKSGNILRITAQLINAHDGTHLWSATYDRKMEDIFKIQDEIASRVTKQLKLSLLGDVIKSKTTDPKAYALYLQSRQLYRQNSSESINNAEKLIQQSIALDSSYAPSWAIFSEIINVATYMYGTKSLKEGYEAGIVAAKKAVELDPNYALGYTVLASFQRSHWNYDDANKNMKKALQLEPDNAHVIFAAASHAVDIGRMEEGIELQLKTIALDPLSYLNHYNLAIYYIWTEQFDKAEPVLQKYALHHPSADVTHALMSLILLGKDEKEKALIEAEKEQSDFWRYDAKCRIVYALGEKEKANTLLREIVEKFGDIAQPNIASLYAYRNEVDAAFKWLELAYDLKDPSLQEILNFPEFKNLHGDPRWNAFINKLGLPKDHGYYMD